MASSWAVKPRDYDKEREKLKSTSVTTFEHPLRGTIVTTRESVGTKAQKSTVSVKSSSSSEASGPSDPLSLLASEALEGTDPLSLLASSDATVPSYSLKSKETKKKNEDTQFGDEAGYIDETFEPWISKRTNILTKYTTSEKLSITTSFLSASDKGKIAAKQQALATDKVKTRLEQLDDFEEGSVKETLNLSQQEYVNRIDDLNQALLTAWESDQRVKSLKIAIQCAKLLGDVSVIQFYPSKFVLITDILDNFGKLVYERIRSKSVINVPGKGSSQSLPEKFTPDQVPETAKETCRNWFYKVASIRELIPRLYVEMAILKCYNFLTTGEYSQALVRLTKQIRGIGDPLVSIYGRTYLCRVGIQVAPQVKDHQNSCLFDFLFSYSQIMDDSVQNCLTKQSVDMASYLQLYPPALDWILQCIAYKASEDTLTQVLEKCKTCNSALVLNSVMYAFNPKYIAQRAIEFNALIKECEDLGFPKYHLYRSLGNSVVAEEPPEDHKLNLLNEVWKVVMKLKGTSEYICCAEVWIEYPLKYFTVKEVNTLLGNIIKHMSPDRAFEEHYPQLLSVLSKITTYVHDFGSLLSMEKFLPFMDMFQKESIKVDACKSIMEAYNRYQTEQTSDPVIINALMSICKTLHDSVNSLTLDDEKRSIGMLLSGFLRSVNYGRDFEQQLTFYVEARANFSNLDVVLVELVQNVNLLVMKTRQIVKGNHTRKTLPFVKACMAYIFITIPSITDVFMRLKLYLGSGRIALANHAVGQADGFFRAAINLISEVPKTILIDHKMKSSEQYLVEYINNILSTLLVVPDHPDHGTLYLVRGLLNVIQEYQWEDFSDAKTRIYLNAICMLSAFCQEKYPYGIHKVDSNDKLYGGDKKFIAEVMKVMGTLLNEIFEIMKTFEEKSERKQAFLALAFINRILSHGDLNTPQVITLCKNLWSLAKKHGQADAKFMQRLLASLERKGKSNTRCLELSSSLQGL